MKTITLATILFTWMLLALEVSAQESEDGPAKVPVSRARISEQRLSTTVGGRLRPANSVAHQASADGIVKSVDVRVGERVVIDQRLFSIEREDVMGSYMPLVVTARISGVVSEIAIQPKNEIRSGAAGVSIIDTSGFSMDASISDKDVFKVEIGSGVQGRVAGGGSIDGTVTARSPEPNYSTGLYTLNFQFLAGEAGHLGQFVAVELPVDVVEGVFISQSSLVRRYGRYFVWSVADENTLKTVPVIIGPMYGDAVLIKEGLAVGDRFVARVTGREREGVAVTPVER
jgi:multidrug efflux pump subunit AcrA (membrane-fusion protein)